MAASYNEIAAWFDEGVAKGGTHLVVVWDTFDNDDYAMIVKPGEKVRDVVDKYNDEPSMRRVMEVYVLDPKRKAAQMSEHRAYHIEDYVP